MKRALTDTWLRAVEPPATGRMEVVDGRTPGLVFRLTASGAASWMYRGRTKDGRATRIKLGDYLPDRKDPGMSLGQARKAAKDAAADLRKGADPVAEKRAAKAARKAQETAARQAADAETGGKVEETVSARLAAWQAARLADPAKPWSPRYAAEVARVCNQAVIPKLGKRQFVETTRQDWTALIGAQKRSVVAAKPKAKGKAGAKRKPGARWRGRCGVPLSHRLGFPELRRGAWLDSAAAAATEGRGADRAAAGRADSRADRCGAGRGVEGRRSRAAEIAGLRPAADPDRSAGDGGCGHRRWRSRPSTWWNLVLGLRRPRFRRPWVEVAGFRWWAMG